MKRKQKRQAPVIESLEPRILLSADLPGLDVPDFDPDDPLNADVDQILARAYEAFEAAAEKSSNVSVEPLQELPVVGPVDEPDVALPSEDVRHELIIVDPSVPDYEVLLAGVNATGGEDTRLEVVMLDPQRGGIEQIGEILASRSDLNAIHLISHGSDGTIQMGGDNIDLALVQREANTFRSWGEALSRDGDILIYGCDLAATSVGEALVDTLAQLTVADVAASADLTGHESLGGNWDLEYRVGLIEADVAIDAGTQAAWRGSLEQTLWLSTDSNVAGPGADGLPGGWTEGQVLNFGGPDLAHGAATDGDLSLAIDFDTFTTDAVDVGAMHFVSRDITVGGGANTLDLKAGDVLVSFLQDETILAAYSSTGSNMLVDDQDLLVFRPNAFNDFSSGTFTILLDDVVADDLKGVTLIEQDTNIGGANVAAGSFLLIAEASGTTSIDLFEPMGVGAGSTTGLVTPFIDLSNLGIDADRLRGIEVIESATTVGGQALAEGALLVTLNVDDNVSGVGSNNLLVDMNDVFVLNLTSTGIGTTAGTATMFLDGSLVGLDNNPSQENPYALALQNFSQLTVDTTSDVVDGDTSSIENLLLDKGADGKISLREAILAANATPNGDVADAINFNITDPLVGGAHTIRVGNLADGGNGALPTLTDAVVIDGTSDSDFAGTPVIELDGSAAGTGDVAAGRRVILPWGEVSFNIADLNADGETLMLRSIEWASGNLPAGNLLFVVQDSGSLLPEDSAKKTLMEGWGYTVNVIDVNDAQVAFDAAIAANDVAFITKDIASGDLGLKLRNAAIGVVSEELAVTDVEFGLNSSHGWDAGVSDITIDDNSHYITAPFATAPLTVFDTPQELQYVTGVQAADLQTLGSTTSGASLVIMEAGGQLYDGTSVDGLHITAGNSTVRGLVINGFGDTAIEIGTGSNNVIQGNYIGTDVSGTGDPGNGPVGSGIVIYGGSSDNTIGGTFAGDQNIIANQVRNGVYLNDDAGTGNAILGNSTFNNGGIGIDLVESGPAYGVTANDSGDGDTGANNLQNFPVINQSDLAGTDLTLSGTLDTDGLGAQYRLEFFGNVSGSEDPTNGEGRFYLGSTLATTDGSGNAAFSGVVLSGVTLNVGDYVTATATRVVDLSKVGVDDLAAYGASSEFSANRAIAAGANVPPVAADDAYSVDEDATLSVDWWDTDWAYRQQLTFGNLAQTENLTNFTVLVKLNSGNIDYAKTKDDGSDLRFFDPDGTALAYEIDTWNESGDSFVWVEVPQIDGFSNADHIVMYYGNASATDGQASASVWDNGYASVWHMDNDPALGAGAIDDSVANPLDGTAVNMDASNLVSGKVGSALSFDGIDEAIRVDSGAADKLAIAGNQLTIEAWVKRDGATGGWMVVVNRQLGIDNSDAYVTAAKYDAPSTYILNTDGGYVESSAGAVPDATWQYLTAVQDGADLLLYSNGALVGSATGAGPLVTDDNDVIIGGAENDATSTISEFFKGLIDEVRISDVARSADWIAAQYASMNDAFVTFGGEESAPAFSGVLANDSDVDDVNLTAVLVSGPSNAATFTFNADGSFSYAPTADFNGIDTFTYKVNDGAGDSNVATVTITVNAVNDAPVSTVPLSQNINEDITLVFSSGNGNAISVGDIDASSSPLRVTLTATNGALTLSQIDGLSFSVGTGTNDAIVTFSGTKTSINAALEGLSYTPDADYNGGASIQIQTSDLGSETIGNDTVYGASTTPGDYDKEQIGTQIVIPESGTLTSVTAYLYIDKPEDVRVGLYADVAGEPGALLVESSAVSQVAGTNWYTIEVPATAVSSGTYWLAMDIGKEGAYFYDTTGGETRHSSFDPASGFSAPWSGTYESNNRSISVYANVTPDSVVAESDTDNITINIAAMNDAGSFGGAVSGSGGEDGGAITGTLSFTDAIDGASAPNFTVTGAAGNGSASIDAVTGGWSYTPGAHFNGSDSFTVTVTDDDGHSETQVINLTVTAVNDAGSFGGAVSGSGGEDGGAITGTLSFTDAIDGASAPNFTVTGAAGNGSASIDAVTGGWSYTPGAHFNGSDSFTVTVTDDDGHSETQVINLTVTAVNDAGSFGGAVSGSGGEDGGAITGTLSFTDAIDGASAPNFTVTGAAGNGSASIDAVTGGWSYTPGAHFNGSDSFTVTVTDDDGHSETQVINLTVTAVNDAGSFGGAVSGSGGEDGGAITGTLSFTDAIDGASAPNFTVTGAAGNGSASIDAVTGGWSYTPGAHFNGSDSFTVTVTDDDGHSETQVINLTVTAVNDAGSFGGAVSGSGGEDGGAITGTLSFTDAIDGASAPNFTVTGAAGNGSASIDAVTGGWSYTPGAHFNGSDSFTVTVTDDDGHSETQVINLTVTAVNDAGSFGGAVSGSGGEDGGAITGTLSFTDAIDGASAPNFTVTGAAGNGSASIDAVTGGWSYTPGAHFNGSDSFTVTVTDDDGHSETQVINLTVTAVNDAGSFGGAVSGSGGEDGGAITGTLSFTDAIDGASAPNFTVTGAAGNGSASIDAVTGGWSYTPGAHFNGSDSFTVTVTDDDGHSETQVINLTVTAVNDAGSFGGAVSGSGGEDGGAITGTLSFTDAIDGASAPNFTVTGAAGNGSASIDAVTGGWSYTPGAHFNGSDSFTVTVTDDDGHSETQVINLTVTAVNDAGSFGGAVSGSGGEDGGAITGTLSFTDAIDGASAPNFTVTGAAGNGSASIDAVTGGWSYTPGAHFNGSDSFTVTVTDDDGHSETQVINLTVTAVNDAGSFGGAVSGSGGEDGGAITGTLSFTDAIDGASAPNFTVTGAAGNGSASIDAVTGGWSYTPGAHFNGSDSFTVTVTDDDGHSETQVINLTVTAVNDAGSFGGAVSGSGGEDGGAITGTLSFTDAIDGASAPNFTVTGAAGNGSASIDAVTGGWSYTPGAHFNGSDSFTVTVTDDDGHSETQVINLTVTAVNDAGSFGGAVSGSGGEDGGAITGTLSFTDAIDGASAPNFTVTGAAGNGSASIDAVTGGWSYTPGAHFNGSDSFTVTVTDDDGHSETQVINLTVTAVNDAGSFGGAVSGSGGEDGGAITGTLSFTDAIDGASAPNFTVTGAAGNGSASIDAVTGGWSYTPGAHFNGSDSFTVTVTDDDGHSETQVINLTVTAVNDAGSFGGAVSGSGGEDGGAITGTLSFTDAIDGASAPNFTVTGAAGNGSASIDAVTGGWSYTPGAHFNGSDSFTVTVTDDDGHSETQVINLTVTAVNDAGSFGGAVSGSGGEDGGAITGTLSFTDAIDGASAPNFTVTGAAGNGSASIDAVTGGWSYTPGAHFNGSDSFTVTVTDDDGHSETQVINLTVTAVNDAGSFGGAVSGSGGEDGGAITGTLSFTDAIDGASAPNFTVTGAAGNGSASIDAVTGGWSYTPGAHFNGSDSFTVTVTDDDGHSETQVINLTVTAVNDAGSFGGAVSGSGGEDGGAITGTLSFTDAIDGASAPNFTVTGAAGNGSASIDAVTGGWSYTPGAHFNGSDSFTVTVTDDDGHSETQVINLTVTAVNDAPVIGGVGTGSVTEEIDPDSDSLLEAAGTLTIADPDAGESSFVAGSIAGSHGTLIIDASGNWDYEADNTQAAIQQLDAGESVNDVLTVTTADGTNHNVTVTINGGEDAPVIGGVMTGAVVEDGTLVANGTLSISDVDAADNPVNFPDAASIPGDNGYGDFQLTAGSWSYTLNNGHAAVQALGVGGSLADTHTFIASDGSTQVVSIMIAGAAEALPPPTVEPPPPPEPTPEPPPVEPPPVPEDAADPPVEEEPDPEEPKLAGTTDPTAGEPETGDPSGNGQNPAVLEPLEPSEILLSVINDARPNDASGIQKSTTAAAKPDVDTAQTFLQELKSFWQAESTTASAEMSEVRFSQAFWNGLDKMANDVDESVEQQERKMQLSAEAAAGVGISLTAGFVSWALRAGSMAASFLAAMPTWRHFDPMPVLAEDKGRKDKADLDAEDDDSPDSADNDTNVDDLFER